MRRRPDFTKWTVPQRRLRYAGRKVTFLVTTALALLSLALADRYGVFGRAPQEDVPKYDGKSFRVARVVDGDTLDLDVPDGKHAHTRVRLLGIDTPECVKPGLDGRPLPPEHFGPEASAFAKKTAANEMVKVELDHARTRDKYERLLAYLYLPDGRMLNEVLVTEGYAYADPRFRHTRESDFKREASAAKAAKRGLWKNLDPNQLPEYLRRK